MACGLVFIVRLWYNVGMNGYDFDKTILSGNSVRRFYCYCLLRLPYLVLYMPVLLLAVILYGVRLLSKRRLLLWLEGYFALVPHIMRFVERFWDKNLRHIQGWYLAQRRDDDVIISASPQFIVEEACRRLGVRCIATDLDARRVRLRGEQCYGSVKADVYRSHFGDAPLNAYYSDSMSDLPMFLLAREGYMVKGKRVKLLYKDGVRVDGKRK